MGRLRSAVRVAAVLAVVGAFLAWTRVDEATLDGTQGPNNGWLVVIIAAFAFGWAGPLVHGSRVAVVGVLGAGAVIVWTAVENWRDNRDVLDGGAGAGTVLVIAAGLSLVGLALVEVIVGQGRGLGSDARAGHPSDPG